MKLIACSGPCCSDRRIHFERQDEARGVQWVQVKDDYEGKAYCSLTCAVLDRAMCLHFGGDDGPCAKCRERFAKEDAE